MLDLFSSISLWLVSISLISLASFVSELVLKPQSFKSFKYSDCFSNFFGSASPKPYAINFKGMFLVSLWSFCLNEPAAAFLGLANNLSIF